MSENESQICVLDILYMRDGKTICELCLNVSVEIFVPEVSTITEMQHICNLIFCDPKSIEKSEQPAGVRNNKESEYVFIKSPQQHQRSERVATHSLDLKSNLKNKNTKEDAMKAASKENAFFFGDRCGQRM